MKVKWILFVIPVILFLQILNTKSGAAVNPTTIDSIRNKTVPSEQDKQTIDRFLNEQIEQLVRITRDFSTVSRIRTIILSKQGTEGQYGNWFSELAKKHIQEGLKQAQTIESQDRRNKVIVNLLILIDGLQDLRLIDLVTPYLNSDNMVIRYWAVHSLTNPGIIKQINSNLADNTTIAENITQRLGQLTETSGPEILIQIAKFADDLDIPQTVDLSIKVADARIKKYEDWTVTQELYDIIILKALEGKLQTASATDKDKIAQRFAQLYSYAIQRYTKGYDILNDTQKRNLISIMIDIEEKCISRILGGSQTGIRRAIERNSIPALIEEHNRLLGSDTTEGQLPAKLNFDYGTTDNGSKRTAPLALPDPPQKPNSNN